MKTSIIDQLRAYLSIHKGTNDSQSIHTLQIYVKQNSQPTVSLLCSIHLRILCCYSEGTQNTNVRMNDWVKEEKRRKRK